MYEDVVSLPFFLEDWGRQVSLKLSGCPEPSADNAKLESRLLCPVMEQVWEALSSEDDAMSFKAPKIGAEVCLLKKHLSISGLTLSCAAA